MAPEKRTNGHAPLALFVYNRPWHTRQTVEALRANTVANQTPLYVFSDAAKNEAASLAVAEIRSYIRTIAGFKSVTIIERETNFGLARSIIDGVTRLCEEFGRVIVIEDDLITSPHFLSYMNDALRFYQNDEGVASVSAYMYPVRPPPDVHDTVLLEFPMSWGWATWNRAWRLFEADGRVLMNRLCDRGLLSTFDQVGPGSFVKMLQTQIDGRNNSWFIRWHATLYLNGKLSLAPTRSMINNIGLDGSGVHCSYWLFNPFMVEPSKTAITVETIPLAIDTRFQGALRRFFLKSKALRYVNAMYRLVPNTLEQFDIRVGRAHGKR